MATIVYSRDKRDPEQIYLPLNHGGYVMLVEGSHQYEEHAGIGLKNSENPTVLHYMKTGKVSVILSDDFVIAPIVNKTEFAPFNPNDSIAIGGRKIEYAPISPTQQVPVSNPVQTEVEKDASEQEKTITKTRKQPSLE